MSERTESPRPGQPKAQAAKNRSAESLDPLRASTQHFDIIIAGLEAQGDPSSMKAASFFRSLRNGFRRVGCDIHALAVWVGVSAETFKKFINRARDDGLISARDWLLEVQDTPDVGEALLRDIDSTIRLRARAPIARQAVEAHNKGLFQLSIPVLLIQGEGVARDIVRMIQGTDENSRGGFLRWAPMKKIIQDKSKEPGFVLDPFLDRDLHNKLNRDNICHGRDVSYASRWNSFVAMGFLRSMIDRYLGIEEMMLSDVETKLLAMLADPTTPSDLITSAMGWLEDWQNGLQRPILYALADKGLVVPGPKPSVTARGMGVLSRKHHA